MPVRDKAGRVLWLVLRDAQGRAVARVALEYAPQGQDAEAWAQHVAATRSASLARLAGEGAGAWRVEAGEGAA